MENVELPESQKEVTENERAPLTRAEFEELVRRALLEVNYQELEQTVAEADEIAYTPSPRYLAWEKKFLADPFHHTKKCVDGHKSGHNL